MENKIPNYLNWKTIGTGIGAGIIFYLIESIGQVLFFSSGSIPRQFFQPDLPSFLSRAFGAGLIAIIAAYAQVLIVKRKQVQEDLRESQQKLQAAQGNEMRYRSYFENTNDVLFLADRDFHIKEVSPSIESVLGYKPEEIKNHSLSELSLLDPNYLEKAFGDAQRGLAGETIRDSEYRLIAKDGTCRYASISSVPLYQEQEIVGSISIARDITERKKIEADLAESEQRYKGLVEESETGIARIDFEGNIIFVNRALSKLTGYREEEMIGKNLGVFIHPADRERVSQLFAKYMTNPAEPYLDEYRIRHKSGGEIYLSTKPTLVYENGQLKGIIAITEDVTERRQAQDLIRVQRDLGVALSAIDSLSLALELCMETALKVSGMDSGGIYLVEEKTGALVLAISRGLSPNFIRLVSYYDALAPNTVLIMQGEPVFAPYRDFSLSQSEIHRQEGLRALAVIPILFEGRVIACFNMASHVSDDIPVMARHALASISTQIGNVIARIKTEEALRESEERYRTLIENMSDAVTMIDLEGKVLFANKATENMTGFTMAEGIGMNVMEITPLEYQPKSMEALKIALEGKPIPDFESMIRKKDGTLIPVETGGQVVYRDGKVIGIQTVTRDITERKRAEEAIRESRERYKKLLDTYPDIAIVTDLEGRIIEVSDKFYEYYGRDKSLADFQGQGFELLSSKQMEKAQKSLQKLIKDGITRNEEYILPMKDGATYVGEINSALIRDSHGQPKEIISTVRDITERKKAEEAIKESRARYKLLLDISNDMVLVTDMAGRIIEASDELIGRYGIKNPQAEVVGTGIDLLAPDQLEKALANFQILLKDGVLKHAEYVFPTFDGKTYIAELNSALIKDAEGRPQAVISTIHDITARKMAEEALRESEEMYRTLAETTSDAITVVDLKGNIVRLSERARELFGGGMQSEITGKSGFEYIAPEHHQAAVQIMQKIFSEGFVRNEEMIFLREDRTPFHAEVNAALIRSTDGEGRAIIAAVRDISGRKRIEEAIQRAANEWLSTFDTMSDMVMLLDQNYTILRVNRAVAKKLNLNFPEIIGKTCYQLMHGTDTPPSFCPHAKTLAEGKEHTEKIHEPLLNRDYIVTDTPIRNESGQIIRTVHVLRDVTEEEKLQASLRRFEKMAAIGEIAGGIAHEIKNPLFAISSSIQVLQDTPGMTKEKKKILNILFEETMRVNRLIKQLLEFGARTRLFRSKQNVRNMINEVIALNRGLLKSKGIRLSKNIPPELPALWVDKDKIIQVLINLLHNAIDVSKKGDRISIVCETGPAKKSLTIRIRDQGPGVPEEIQGKIFAPFFSTKRGNTGMGLAISRKIITEHGGDLRWEPNPGTPGSTFLIELPWGSETQ